MLERVLLLTLILSFVITVILSPIFIPFLRRLKFGQSIREEGPKSHQKKSGTPTMGGLMILLSILVSSLFVSFQLSIFINGRLAFTISDNRLRCSRIY
ncbi:BH2569 [Halalkalibacterium halodurans C-125]|nr:BH2569 [Halalkalibacterium halodurans C-125]